VIMSAAATAARALELIRIAPPPVIVGTAS